MRAIFIERSEDILRIAIKENSELTECFVEEETKEPLPGEIYKGIVKSIVPAIKCAFVDIGYEKNAFMSLSKEVRLKQGDEIVVEVIKEAIGDKGPKVIMDFSLPGKYSVINSKGKGINISKRIEDENRKAELLKNIKSFEDAAITIRTSGAYCEIESIINELDELYEEYKTIKQKAKYHKNPQKLYGDNPLLHKILRDKMDKKTKKIYVNKEEDYKVVLKYLEEKQDIQVELYNQKRTLFDFYGIEREILSLRHNKVSLNCGGYIVIDKTEAMHVIDVNSGKNTKGKNREKTGEETNKEAAKEIARQIRVRNLAGIILIDFIDITSEESKKEILDILRSELESDKNRTQVFPFTELNLVQISRKRSGRSIFDMIEEKCLTCNGMGERLALSYVSILIRNDIIKFNGENSISDFYIQINSQYESLIKEDLFKFLTKIEALDCNIYINYVDEVEYFKVEPLLFKNQIENVEKYLITL
ncbi:Rne/Rng family ribonuclease [Clostridium intestinale]|uniref:Rne/Rng family ribonuclease n=1 Tax=Clostridium intestinale TaxID=36845 RepID=UPI002DD6850A|nr:Rne/Rng family ribonuclease [Clostridium intestinale]WRY49722.1 Rne/Rng family ribonuclease [Clostridium intestinale]